MAGKLNILIVLCLVAHCFAQGEEANPTSTTSTTPIASTTITATPAESTTTTTATPAESTTTTTATPAESTTTTNATTTAESTITPNPDASTTNPDPSATTVVTSGGTGSTVATTKPQPTPKPTDPCASTPCGHGSTCAPRFNDTFVCLCLAGENYNDDTKSCEGAKVFPGELSLTKVPYKAEMEDKKSKVFIDTAGDIVREVTKGFTSKSSGFSGVTVLELLPLTVKSSPGVYATIDIIYKANAVITENEVKKQIQTAIDTAAEGSALSGASFQEKDLCESANTCDDKTATCLSGGGEFNCTCKDGYIKTEFSTRLCVACPSGQKRMSDTECTACSFGYSGFNCNESWQLVLTIVGSVLGGLLLVTLILLPVVALKSPKKSSKKSKEADIGLSQVNQPNTKAPMNAGNFSNSNTAPANGPANGFANAGMQKFPRVAATNNWDSRTNLDMTLSNSRQNLIPASKTSRYDDDDDTGYAQVRPQGSIYSQTRPQSNPHAQTQPQGNPYAQTRPQSNLYAQTRPQSNPYAPSQGQSGTYFAQDVGRRY